MNALPQLLFVLGVGFLVADVRLFLRTALSPAASVGAAHLAGPQAAVLRFSPGARRDVSCPHRLQARRLDPPRRRVRRNDDARLYGYAVPLSLKIGRGFYEDGIWADAGVISLLTNRRAVRGAKQRAGDARLIIACAHLRESWRAAPHYGPPAPSPRQNCRPRDLTSPGSRSIGDARRTG